MFNLSKTEIMRYNFIIDFFKISGKFMKSNIVMMVILLVSLFWIPISWVTYNTVSVGAQRQYMWWPQGRVGISYITS